jgi:hypothetical protein
MMIMTVGMPMTMHMFVNALRPVSGADGFSGSTTPSPVPLCQSAPGVPRLGLQLFCGAYPCLFLDYVHTIRYSHDVVNRDMYMDFKKITDELFARLTSDDLAKEAKVSAQTIRKARLEEGTTASRSPPPGWAAAAMRLAEKQAKHFQKLADKLRASE